MIVEGTVYLGENRISFLIDGESGSFHQWGAPNNVLGETVDLMEGLRDAVWAALSDMAGRPEAGCKECGLGQQTPHSEHGSSQPNRPTMAFPDPHGGQH